METRDDLAVMERIRIKLTGAQTKGGAPGEYDPRAVLRERARKLAQEIPPPEEGDTLQIVEFRIGRERLAFESAWVREVLVPRTLVKVPCTPPFVAGIINLRGAILSVLDLRRILDISAEEEEMKVVLLLSDEEMEFGVSATEVDSARNVFHHDIKLPLYAMPEEGVRLQRGILPGAVSLLDARLLLASPQWQVNQREKAP